MVSVPVWPRRNLLQSTENGGNEVVSDCCCVCILNSSAMMMTEEGFCCPIRHTYLLLGLEDGRILFMDPVVKGQKFMEFKASKDPSIQDMRHDAVHSTLITVVRLKELALIQMWSLPTLQLYHEVYCAVDVMDYTCLLNILHFQRLFIWKRKRIQRVKVFRGMSFPDARKFVEATTVGPSGKSFADAARVAKPASTKSVSVQTDMTWPEQLPTFALLPSTQKTMKLFSSTQTTTITHPKTATGKKHQQQTFCSPKPTKNKSLL
ncbi:hypothetical protein ScPMuIL_008547 [Solemya velum]